MSRSRRPFDRQLMTLAGLSVLLLGAVVAFVYFFVQGLFDSG